MSADNIIIQKVEVLNGDRGNPDDAAARMRHIRALVASVPAQPSARPAAGAPTQAEYDALFEDVQKLFAAFNSLRASLR